MKIKKTPDNTINRELEISILVIPWVAMVIFVYFIIQASF